MEMRRIPDTDIDVSVISLGTMTFGSPVGEEDAIRLVHHAIDKGINFIDTANMYEGYARYAGSPGGVAESILGKALDGRRDKVVVATKVGMKVGEAPEDDGTSPAAIFKHLDKSLERMNTDYVDIYYLHRPDPSVPVLDTLQALDQVMRDGKVRHYGISNYSAEQTQELLDVADANDLPRPVMVQPPLSLLKQDACSDLLPLCQREWIAAAPYQIFQGGLLTGKYRRGQAVPDGSRKAEHGGWVWELNDELFDKLEMLESEAKASGLSLNDYAVKWVLDQPAVVSAIIGAKRADQVDAAISAVRG